MPYREPILESEPKSRPGEKIQEFWCEDCREWHRASVLGGAVTEETEGK